MASEGADPFKAKALILATAGLSIGGGAHNIPLKSEETKNAVKSVCIIFAGDCNTSGGLRTASVMYDGQHGMRDSRSFMLFCDRNKHKLSLKHVPNTGS